MKKRRQKFTALLLTGLMTVTVLIFPGAAAGEEKTPGDDAFGFTYSFVSENEIEITSYSGFDAEVTVPSKIDGYTVVGIKDFHNEEGYIYPNEFVKKIILPDTVRYISDEAFYQPTDWTTKVFSSLMEIVLPEGLKTIGKDAFGMNMELQKIEIPASVTDIERGAFYGCTNLSSVTFKGNNTFVHGGAFGSLMYGESFAGFLSELYNEWLYDDNSSDFFVWQNQLLAYKGESKTPVIPDSVKAIAGRAFAGSEITGVTIPQGVKEIGQYAFYETGTLESVVIPSSVEVIDNNGFCDCPALKSVTFNKGLKRINDGAFRDCEALTSVVLPEGLTALEDCAFYDCENLEKISFPNSLIEAEMGCFGETKWYYNHADDEDIYVGSVYIGRPMYDAYPSKLTVRAGTKTVFIENDLQDVNELILPDSLKSITIEDAGFSCNIKNLKIPEGVDYINIQGMPKLENITLPARAQLGEGCFAGCQRIKVSKLPEGNVVLKNVCFGNTKNVVLPDDTLELRGGGIFGNYEQTDTVSVDLNNVRIIKDGALSNLNALTSITIPDSVTTLGENVFSNCSNLKSIKGGKNVKYIGNSCFSDCTSLTDFGSLTDNVTRVEMLAFQNTAWFNSQSDGVVYFGKVAYAYKGDAPSNTVVALKPGTVSVSEFFCDGQTELNTFKEQLGIVGVILPESCKYVGVFAFSLCKNLKYIVLGGVRYIEREAFNSNACESIVLPDSVRFVGNNAFSSPNIKSIYLNDGLVVLDEGAFFTYGAGKGVTVPDSVEYIGINALGWSPIDSDDMFGGLKVNDGFTIYGSKETAGEDYAVKNEITFVSDSKCSEHDFVTEEIPASPYSASMTRKTCIVCGYVSVIQNGDGPVIHTHTNQTIKGKPATCTEPGLTDGVKCSVCDEILTPQKEIPALGHKFADGVCTVCGAKESGTDPNPNPNPKPNPNPIPSEDKLVLADNSKASVDYDNALIFIKPEKTTGVTLGELESQFAGLDISPDDTFLVPNGFKFTYGNTQYTVIIKGDVNFDGKITAVDARIILRIAAKLETADEITTYAADINSDSKVTAKEARSVLRFAAKLSTSIE